MGVRGLKSFIAKNDDLLIKDYQLHDTALVIDACNLVSELIKESQKHERPDLFGGNMVQFGNYVNNFFHNLTKCKIHPILVFDGAQTRDVNKNKTTEKHRRAMESFQNVMSITQLGFGDFILPVTASSVFRSIAVDKRIQIIQCMYEADLEVARIANRYKCPVLSNDSDFYLLDLPNGLIPIDLMKHKQVFEHIAETESSNDCDHYNYLLCHMYKQDNFVKYFPGLDKECLPLLGVLAGNDFIEARVFDRICSQMPSQRISENLGYRGKLIKKVGSRQHEKILKILYYLCDKSLNQTINEICFKVHKDNRVNLKKLIKSNLQVYEIPTKDDFEDELIKLYKPGFNGVFKQRFGTKEELELHFRETIRSILRWLRNAMERSVLSFKCLELAHRNKLFLRSYMDDPKLPSAHTCHIRCLEVMLSLLKSSNQDSNKPCIIYDRLSSNHYGKTQIYPSKLLEKFGPLKFLFYDVPKLPENIRMAILLATFHHSLDEYSEGVIQYFDWFDSNNAEEFLLIKFLLRYIDTESPKSKLWVPFKRAVLICIIYYRLKLKKDVRLSMKLADSEFVRVLNNVVEKYKYAKTPQLSMKRLYNCRLMHQISQLQTSIMSYNLLNAFLGDALTRIRSENWLNSCLLYNLTENFKAKRLEELERQLPSIIRLFINHLAAIDLDIRVLLHGVENK